MLLRLKRPVNDDSYCKSFPELVTSVYGFLALPGCAAAQPTAAGSTYEGKVIRVSRSLIVVSGQRLNNYVEAVTVPPVGSIEISA